MRIEQEVLTKTTGEDVDRQLSQKSEQDALEERFFSEPPKIEPVDTFWDLDTESDDEEGVERVRKSRRAMIVTLVILGVAVVGISSYTVYAKVVMPTPVAMGAVTRLPELPQPIYDDSQGNRGSAQISTSTRELAQAQSAEQERQNTTVPLAVEHPSTPSVETGAVDRERQTAEIEQEAATDIRAEPKEDKSVTAPMTEPPVQETPGAESDEALAEVTAPSVENDEALAEVATPSAENDKALAEVAAPSAEKDKALAEVATEVATARPASEAVSSPVETAAEDVRPKVKRSRAARRRRRSASTAEPPSEYKTIVKRANALYRSRKTRERAVAEYKRALTLKPNGGEALRRLSYHYLNQGISSEAERLADRAVRANQNNAQNWFLLGAARDARNNRQGAQQAYRSCAQGKGAYAQRCEALIR